MIPSKQSYRILHYVYFTILWLSTYISYAQGLCDKTNWPPNSVEGAFKIEGDITAGCSPMAVRLKDLSGGTDIRYDFYYDGKPANLLDKVGNQDSTNLALFSNPNSLRYYTILQYGKKNSKDMYKCMTVSVRPNNQPVFSYNSCNNNSVEINIPKLSENNFDFYEVNWGDGSLNPEKILKDDLPYSKTKSLTLPRTIKVEGQFTNTSLNCSSPSSITIPFKIPTLFPNGYDDPNKVNIDNLELISATKALLKFHGAFDTNGYELFRKEKGTTYISLGTNFSPGEHLISIPDSTKSYCFYLDRQTSCGSDPSAELCTLPLFSVELDEKDDFLKWSDYPTTISTSDNRSFGRYLDKTQAIVVKKENNISPVIIDNSITQYTYSNVDCKKKMCYRVSMKTSGQLYYYKYSGITTSNEICTDRKTFNPPAISDLMVSVKVDNSVELVFNDNSNWSLEKDMYYLFKTNNTQESLIDSIKNISAFLDKKSSPDIKSECYYIKYKDECESVSKPSPQICTINLSSKNDDELFWTNSSPFGNATLKNYAIISINEISNIESIINLIDETTTNSKADLDGFEIEAKFRIKGISDNNKESYSNVLKIPIEALFYVPDAYTPNGDQENKTFEIKGRFGRVSQYHLEIFDRWGTKLLDILDFTNHWDGTIKGKQLPNGTYLYKLRIDLNNGEKHYKQGKIELLR